MIYKSVWRVASVGDVPSDWQRAVYAVHGSRGLSVAAAACLVRLHRFVTGLCLVHLHHHLHHPWEYTLSVVACAYTTTTHHLWQPPPPPKTPPVYTSLSTVLTTTPTTTSTLFIATPLPMKLPSAYSGLCLLHPQPHHHHHHLHPLSLSVSLPQPLPMQLPSAYNPAAALSTITYTTSPEARCPARRMLVNAREWRNIVTWSGVAYTTSGFKARSNARWRGRSLAFKTRWRMCFSGFRTSRSPSFVFMKTFSFFFFFDRQNTYSCKSDLFANFSAVYIFPCTLNGDIP